jgi:hypothetical protein
MTDFLVVKDEEGILRPMAGIWRDDEAGEFGAAIFLKYHPNDSIVKARLIETK